MANLIENGKLAQRKFFNLDDEALYKEFEQNKYNPIYKECFEEMICGSCDWSKISRNLQLMYFACLEIDGKSTRIFFQQELGEMDKSEIEEILKGNFVNIEFVKSYYDRYYGERENKGISLYYRNRIKVGDFQNIEDAKKESTNVDGVYKFMSTPAKSWIVKNGVIC